MTLPHDVSRCAARYGFGEDSEWCPMRMTCRRYTALLHEDAAAGLPDYKGIPVYMGRPDCQDRIEVAHD